MHSPPSESLVEDDSIRLLGVCALLLFLFAAAFFLLYPNREKGTYTTLHWVTRPFFESDLAGSTIHFGVALSSVESTAQDYSIVAKLNGKEVRSKNVQMFPGERKELDYSVPIETMREGDAEVRVIVSKTGAGMETVPLELVDWVFIPKP